MKIRVLSCDDVRQALPMKAAIEASKKAFSRLSSGRVEMPLRSRIHIPEQEGVLLTMPAALLDDGEMAVKLVTVFGKNPARGFPLIHAVLLVLDAENGQVLSLMDADVLTAVRTGAGVGVATDLLAPPEANSVAIIGSGKQAVAQLDAVCSVRDIQQAWVYSPNPEHAQSFAEKMSGVGPIPKDVRAVSSSAEALKDADIVCTATTSTTPVISFEQLKAGAHVNAVGSFQPTMQEIDGETIRNALVVVDSRESALIETGDIVTPLKQGLITPEHIHAEIGEIINGAKNGRSSQDQLTFFKSCGVAAQDAVTAAIALKNAERENLGTLANL